MANQVQCPKCKNFKTAPYGTSFMDDFIEAWFGEQSFEREKLERFALSAITAG